MNNLCDAFISYGRADSKSFATKLHARLVEEGLKVWFDQNDIPLGVDYQNQIDDGIEKAHNFLFIIAPHSVNSPYCLKEIVLALKRNKRIIPLLQVEQISWETWQQRNPNGTTEEWEAYKAKGLHTSFQNMHPTISKINWVYFREGIDDFETAFAGLISLIRRQADYVEQHTRFLAKALEWERHQKQTSYLLIGEERLEAEAWLKIRFKDEQPPCIPSDLHCELITESIKNASNLMTQVFLSYADVDRATMEKIRNSLRRESITVWTNKSDIQTGEAFEEAINRGIEQADNVVYLLSPDSVKSDYCQKELEYALSLCKRIIPVLVRETNIQKELPALRGLQYIDLTDNIKEEDYLLDESQLLKILYQDAAYYNEHKILLTKALKWQRQHDNPTILLGGYNLRHAETWLKVAKQRTQHPPTLLQEEFINASLRQPPASSLDVFISYSRADSDFARKLNDELQMQGKTTWFDQESIASGSEFEQEIKQGIKVCDNFLFIISPRSVNSPYCADEVEYASELNKRFITVLHREVNVAILHPELAKVQWVDFNQNQRDFNANFNQLVRTLDTDREHVHSHTKWLQRAIEWNEKDRSTDLLLRGNEFAIAQNWLKEAEQQKKQPAVTSLQKEYITVSGNAIAAGIKRKRWRLIILRSLLGLMSIVAVAAVFQWRRAEIAQEASINSVIRFSLELSKTDQKLDALIEAIRAGRQLQKETHINPNSLIKSRVLTALQAAIYGHGFTEKNRLAAHKYGVHSISFSPDGKTLASGSGDRTVKLWSLDGKELNTLTGHTKQVNSIAWSPDGKTIATASNDKTVRLWSAEGKLIQTFQGHIAQVKSVVWSPDGKTIATASNDKTARLWSLDGKQLKIFPHQDGVSSVSFKPDSKTLASASLDRTINFWSLNGKQLKNFQGHTKPINTIVWSLDGKTVASASVDKTIKLWSREGKFLRTLKGHEQQVNSITWSPDGKTIVTASDDKTVILWNRDKGIRQLTLKGHIDNARSVSFSHDGKILASSSWDGTIILWRFDGKELKTLKGHQGPVGGVSYSPDGKTIASASDDKTIKLWSVDGKELQTLQGHEKFVYNVVWSPDGKMLASASQDNTIKIWNLDGKLLQTLSGHKDEVRNVSFSPDGKTIASASWDDTVILWNLNKGIKQLLPKKHKDDVNSVSFSPNGKTIASASDDGTIKLWSLDGKLLRDISAHDGIIYSVAWSPDGQTLASASNDQTIKLWSREGKKLKTLKGHKNKIISVAWSRDGKMLASASTDNTIKLWTSEGKELQTLVGHTDHVYSVSFSRDGKTLASASADGTIILWNLADLQLDKLMQDACDWVGDYLKNNSQVEENDKHLCDGVHPSNSR